MEEINRSNCTIVLLGAGGVGKSALVLRFSEDKFNPTYDPTLEDLYQDKVHTVDGIPIKIDLLDTAGQEEYNSLHENWINEGDAFMVVYSVTETISYEEAESIYEKIMDIRDNRPTPIVFVGNKIDLQHLIQVKRSDAQNLADSWSCPLFETSAKDNILVQEAFYELIREFRRKQPRQTSQRSSNPSCCAQCTIL